MLCQLLILTKTDQIKLDPGPTVHLWFNYAETSLICVINLKMCSCNKLSSSNCNIISLEVVITQKRSMQAVYVKSKHLFWEFILWLGQENPQHISKIKKNINTDHIFTDCICIVICQKGSFWLVFVFLVSISLSGSFTCYVFEEYKLNDTVKQFSPLAQVLCFFLDLTDRTPH